MWMPATSKVIELSESEGDTTSIVNNQQTQQTQQLVLCPESNNSLKLKEKKLKRTRKKSIKDTVSSDTSEDEENLKNTRTNRKYKKSKNNNNIRSVVVFGEVSSTTNVDTNNEESSNSSDKKLILNGESLKPHLVEETEKLTIKTPKDIDTNSIENLPKLKVQTNLEYNWSQPSTSAVVNPLFSTILSPDDPIMADEFWSEIKNDYFGSELNCMIAKNSQSDNSCEVLGERAEVLSQFFDRFEPELNNHVNMAQICENRDWRKNTIQENVVHDENPSIHISPEILYQSQFDSPLFF